MAWVSDAAKIADGGSGDFSSSGGVLGRDGRHHAGHAGPGRRSNGRPAAVSACRYPRSRSAEEVKPSPAGRPRERQVADEADPAVAQPDQVPGGQQAARHVIDDRLRHSGVGRVHADQRHPGPGELGELLAGQRQADGQHAVGPVGGQQRLQVPVPLGRGVHVADDRVVALLVQHGQRAGHPDHGRRPGHVRDEHRDGARRAADQRRRRVAGPVAQPLDGVLDGAPGRGPDLVARR